MDERKYNYKREQSPLHVKSYEFAVRIVKMFLHLSDVDWRLASIYRQVLGAGCSCIVLVN